VNGKIRARYPLPINMIEEEVKKIAFSNETVQKYLEAKQIVKIIFVQNKLINVVVK
jgi:leucyl-tRNA synthetase